MRNHLAAAADTHLLAAEAADNPHPAADSRLAGADSSLEVVAVDNPHLAAEGEADSYRPEADIHRRAAAGADSSPGAGLAAVQSWAPSTGETIS